MIITDCGCKYAEVKLYDEREPRESHQGMQHVYYYAQVLRIQQEYNDRPEDRERPRERRATMAASRSLLPAGKMRPSGAFVAGES